MSSSSRSSSRTKCRKSTPLAALGALAILFTAIFVACGSGTAVEEPAAQQKGPGTISAERLSATTGWVLTDEGLKLTGDGGTTWSDVTPKGLTPSSIKGIFFLDSKHGWLIAPEPDTSSLLAYRTQDGGSSWQPSQLGASDADSLGAPAYLSFPDIQNGWVVIKLVTSLNFSKGDLYRTTDGGVSWTKLSIPIGDPVVFSGLSNGFVAGGPAGDQLYVTRDGGASWEPQTVPPPPQFSASYPAYGLPTFTKDGTAVLPVTFTGPASGIAIYLSDDGGTAWSLQQSLALQQALNIGVRMPTDVIDSGAWVAAAPRGKIFRAAGATQQIEVIAPNGLPSGVVDIDFVDGSNGWAVVHEGKCPPGLKDGCTVIQQLFATTDGGQTWAVVVPG